MTTELAVFYAFVMVVVILWVLWTARQMQRDDEEFERRLEVQFKAIGASWTRSLSMPIECREVVITKVLDATDDLTGDRYIHAMIEYDVEHWYPCRGFDVAPQAGDRAWLIMPMDDVYYLTP